MLETILILIGNFLHFLDRMVYYMQMIVFHSLVCVRNARTLTGMLVRGTRTWIVMCFRLVLFSITVAPGFYRVVIYYFTHPLILRNVEYSPNGSRNRNLLDIYLPIPCDAATRLKHNIKEYPDGAPVVIFVSGGAWTIGYKMWCSFVGRQFASLGFLTIAPDYRNFPQGDIKDMMSDVKQAVLWTYNNAHRFGGNPNKIVLAGQSAGAHISLCILVEEFLQKKLLQQRREQFKIQQQTLLQQMITQHPITELTQKYKQELSKVVVENDEEGEASLNATMTSAFADDSSTFLTYSVYPLNEKPLLLPTNQRIESETTNSSMIFQENPMFLSHNTNTPPTSSSSEQPMVDGTWYAPLQAEQRDQSFLSAFSPALSTPSSSVISNGFHTPVTAGTQNNIPISESDHSISRLFPEDSIITSGSAKRSNVQQNTVPDSKEALLLDHIFRDEEVVTSTKSLQKSEDDWSANQRPAKKSTAPSSSASSSVAFTSDVSPIASSTSHTESPAMNPSSPGEPLQHPNTFFEPLDNMPTMENNNNTNPVVGETISDKIQVFIAVSGPFNLHALKSHLHHRGLDSSILSWICRGDLCQYSPTVQLYRYVNDEAQVDTATATAATAATAADPMVTGSFYQPPMPYNTECEATCSSGLVSSNESSANMTVAQDMKEVHVNIHTILPAYAYSTAPGALSRPVPLLNPNAYPSTMKFTNTNTTTTATTNTSNSTYSSSSGKNVYTNSSHYLSLKHDPKQHTTTTNKHPDVRAHSSDPQDSLTKSVTETKEKTNSFFTQLLTFPIKFMTDEEYWHANHTDELPYLHLHEEFNHQHSITTKQQMVTNNSHNRPLLVSKEENSKPFKPMQHHGTSSSSSSSSSPIEGHTDRESESESDHPSATATTTVPARVYQPLVSNIPQPLNETTLAKELIHPAVLRRPKDTHLLPVQDDKLSDFPSIVVFHGTKDDSIPVSISDELVYLLRTHGTDVSYKLYENWSHTDMILEAPLIGNMRCVKDIQKVVYQYTDMLQPVHAINPMATSNHTMTGGLTEGAGAGSGRGGVRGVGSTSMRTRRRAKSDPNIDIRTTTLSGKSVSFAPHVSTFGEGSGSGSSGSSGSSIINAKPLLGEEQLTPKVLVRIARHINPF